MVREVAALGHAIVANNGSDSQTIVAEDPLPTGITPLSFI